MDIIQVACLIGVAILGGVLIGLVGLQFLEDMITDYRKWRGRVK